MIIDSDDEVFEVEIEVERVNSTITQDNEYPWITLSLLQAIWTLRTDDFVEFVSQQPKQLGKRKKTKQDNSIADKVFIISREFLVFFIN